MKKNFWKHGTRASTGQSASRILVAMSLLIAVFASPWLFTRDLSRPKAPASRLASAPAERYRGVVQLAPNEQGRCEQFELDNKAGMVRAKGIARCSEITSAKEPLVGTMNRVNSITESFKSR